MIHLYLKFVKERGTDKFNLSLIYPFPALNCYVFPFLL